MSQGMLDTIDLGQSFEPSYQRITGIGNAVEVIQYLFPMVRPKGDAIIRPSGLLPADLFPDQPVNDTHQIQVAIQMSRLEESTPLKVFQVSQVGKMDPLCKPLHH